MNKYQLTSDTDTFDLTTEDIQKLDIELDTVNKQYHLIHNKQSVQIESIQSGSSPKSISVKLNGNTYHFQIKDQNDLLVDELGMDAATSKTLSEITAPMPGLIMEILVKPGDTFEAGDPLFILEAMKMENMIKAEGSGTVKKILVNQNDPVDKNQVILDLEEL